MKFILFVFVFIMVFSAQAIIFKSLSTAEIKVITIEDGNNSRQKQQNLTAQLKNKIRDIQIVSWVDAETGHIFYGFDIESVKEHMPEAIIIIPEKWKHINGVWVKTRGTIEAVSTDVIVAAMVKAFQENL